MAKKNDAKRAAKKHAKEKKRQKKLADRRDSAAVEPLERWKAERDGIEGLARLLKTDSHHAAILADRMAALRQKRAQDTWHPARVRKLDTDALLAELANRGVTTDEATFRGLAERHESARALAIEAFGPQMRAEATVHDRDLVGEAAEVLWGRWCPERVTNERLGDELRDLDERMLDAPSEGIAGLLDLSDRLREVGGAPRLDRVTGDSHTLAAYLLGALDNWHDDDERGELDHARIARLCAELLPITEVDTPEHAGLTRARAEALGRTEGIGAAVDALVHYPGPANRTWLLTEALSMAVMSLRMTPEILETLRGAFAELEAEGGDVAREVRGLFAELESMQRLAAEPGDDTDAPA